MFLLLRAFHTHQHSEIACPVEPTLEPELASLSPSPTQQHVEVHQHVHTHSCDHGNTNGRGLGWLGMLFGLGLHTMMDGVALAASVFADWHPDTFLGLAGLGTFLAVALHKPLDAFAITSVMQRSGWPIGQRNFVNLLFSLACPIGAFLFYIGAKQLTDGDAILGWGLAISAGFFICIALADLLPEVSFHDHDRGKLTTALLLGILLAITIENLPGHEHDHQDHTYGYKNIYELKPLLDRNTTKIPFAVTRLPLDAKGQGFAQAESLYFVMQARAYTNEFPCLWMRFKQTERQWPGRR